MLPKFTTQKPRVYLLDKRQQPKFSASTSSSPQFNMILSIEFEF